MFLSIIDLQIKKRYKKDFKNLITKKLNYTYSNDLVYLNLFFLKFTKLSLKRGLRSKFFIKTVYAFSNFKKFLMYNPFSLVTFYLKKNQVHTKFFKTLFKKLTFYNYNDVNKEVRLSNFYLLSIKGSPKINKFKKFINFNKNWKSSYFKVGTSFYPFVYFLFFFNNILSYYFKKIFIYSPGYLFNFFFKPVLISHPFLKKPIFLEKTTGLNNFKNFYFQLFKYRSFLKLKSNYINPIFINKELKYTKKLTLIKSSFVLIYFYFYFYFLYYFNLLFLKKNINFFFLNKLIFLSLDFFKLNFSAYKELFIKPKTKNINILSFFNYLFLDNFFCKELYSSSNVFKTGIFYYLKIRKLKKFTYKKNHPSLLNVGVPRYEDSRFSLYNLNNLYTKRIILLKYYFDINLLSFIYDILYFISSGKNVKFKLKKKKISLWPINYKSFLSELFSINFFFLTCQNF